MSTEANTSSAAPAASRERKGSVSQASSQSDSTTEPIVRIVGTNDVNDFDKQKAFVERSDNEELNVPHLHSSKVMEKLKGCPRTRPLTNLSLEDFTSLRPQEFHPRDDQPMMGRGGHGWISEVDGTTTTTAATPDKKGRSHQKD